MTRRLAIALATAVLVLAACANAPANTTGPGTGSDLIAHPTDPNQPILVVRSEGGFVAPDFYVLSSPSFALYGDGTLVVPGAQPAIYPGAALPAMIARTVNEDGIQAILGAALDAGLDHDGDYSDLGQLGIADAGSTRFELTVGGVTHVVTAYALGMEGSQQPGEPDDVWAMRRGLERLDQRLTTLDWLPTGSLGAERPYRATAARLLVGPYAEDPQLPQDPKEWPLATELGAFGDPTTYDPKQRCGVVSGDDWTAVGALAAEANSLTPWASDGRLFSVAFRPLLPDEAGCAIA